MADDWGDTAVEEAPSVEVKLFGRWNPDDVQINDISLAVSYIYAMFSVIKRYIIVNCSNYCALLVLLLGLYSSKREPLGVSTSHSWSLCCQEI